MTTLATMPTAVPTGGAVPAVDRDPADPGYTTTPAFDPGGATVRICGVPTAIAAGVAEPSALTIPDPSRPNKPARPDHARPEPDVPAPTDPRGPVPGGPPFEPPMPPLEPYDPSEPGAPRPGTRLAREHSRAALGPGALAGLPQP